MLGMNRIAQAGRSAYRNPAVSKAFKGMGTPQIGGLLNKKNYHRLTDAQRITRGKRRAAVVGGALVLNSMVGPSGSRSSGGRGYTMPRSTGGYA